MELIWILIIPALAGVLSLVPVGKGRFAAGTTIIGAVAVFILSTHVALTNVEAGGIVAIRNWLSSNSLGVLILLLVAFTNMTASLFSWGYTDGLKGSSGPGRTRRYYARYNLFVLSLLAVPILAQIAIVWIAVELTTLLSVFLVSFEDSSEALEAAWKYAVLTCMGAALALFGVILLYAGMKVSGGSSFTWDGLAAASAKMPPVLLKTAFMFILIGFGTKAGLVPLHTWLPDAHSQAPSPICALLSGVETSTALYVIIKLLPVLGESGDGHIRAGLIVFGLLSVGVAAFLILQVKDYKRLFAFSTIEHMGIILVAAGLSGQAAHFAATYQIMSHALAKSFCFFAAGLALMVTGTRDIASVRGLIRTSPLTGVALIIGGLAIAGAPPFAVFLSEFSILKAGLAGGQYIAMGLLALFIVIAFWGTMVHVTGMVFGKASEVPARRSLPTPCILSLCVTLILLVLLGLYVPEPLHGLLRLAAISLGR
jgi:hydrogenase-4 component F